MGEENEVFRAVADETRRDILRLLSSARLPVGDLAASFPGISRPAVSKHLRILRQAGLVSESRDGRRRLYRLHPEALDAIGRWLAEVEPHGPSVPHLAVAEPRVGSARPVSPRSRLKRRRPPAGVRPLRRDEPEDGDWRAW